MAFTYALGLARTTSAANPITTAYTVADGDTVLALLVKAVGASNRAGGAPTLGGVPFTQANSTQKAAASPEASAELWYLLNPQIGAFTLTLPNTGAISCSYTVAIGRAALGGRAAFDGANGGNNTATNPTPGAVTVTQAGGIGFAIVASGADTWASTARVGTLIADTDDGTNGSGEQYVLNPALGAHTLSWTFATSEDWGAVAAYFKEVAPVIFENYKTSFRAVSTGVTSLTEKRR